MATEADRLKRIEIRLALQELNSAFTYHLDHNEVDELVALFSEDAIYTHGERRSEGRDAIEQLFRNRTASGPRTARHIYSGLKLDIENETRARGASICLTFAGDGVPPLIPATPYLVADFNDVYTYADGSWYIQERHITRIFADPHNPGPVGHKIAFHEDKLP